MFLWLATTCGSPIELDGRSLQSEFAIIHAFLCDFNTNSFVLISKWYLKMALSCQKCRKLPEHFLAQQATDLLLKLADDDSENKSDLERG